MGPSDYPNQYVSQGTLRNPEAVAPRYGTYRGGNVEFRGEEFPAEEHPLYEIDEGYTKPEPEYDDEYVRDKLLEEGRLKYRNSDSAMDSRLPRPGGFDVHPAYRDPDPRGDGYGRPKVPRDIFGKAWDSLLKRSYIENRPKRLAQAKVQRLARKTKTRKTKARYARALSRGTVRPRMRRQTGLVRVSRKR